MTKLYFQYLAISAMRFAQQHTNCAKVSWKLCSKPNKLKLYCQIFLNICQSGGISPNLVTLYSIDKKCEKHWRAVASQTPTFLSLMENLILQLAMVSSSARTLGSHPSTNPVNGSGFSGDVPLMHLETDIIKTIFCPNFRFCDFRQDFEAWFEEPSYEFAS